MNVQDIFTRIQRTFGDEAAVQVNSSDIIRWINDAQVEIVKHNDAALQKTDLINLVANQSTYSMPADFFLLRSLRYKFPDMQSFRHIKYLNMQQFDNSIDGWDGTSYTSGNPAIFTVYENQVILFPTPSTSVTDGLKVLYNQKPTDVASLSDNLALPLIYHNTVVKYCMWQASLLDEDHEPALMYRGEFENDMGVLKNRETSDPNEYYPIITVLEEDL